MEINQSLRFTDYSLITSNKDIKVKINTEEFENKVNELVGKFPKKTENSAFNIEIALLNFLIELSKFKEVRDNNNVMDITWKSKNGYLYTENNKNCLAKFNTYKLNELDYIMLGQNELLIDIDLTELADMIAFELMHRDMGFDTNDIEKLLENCSLIHENTSDKLNYIYKNDKIKPYNLSKELKFSESPYYSIEDNYLRDYFLVSKYKNPDDYNKCVSESCRMAMSRIALYILESIKKQDDKLKDLDEENKDIDIKLYTNLVYMSDTGITFITNRDIMDVKKHITPVNVRCFGRRFQVNPKITIY